MNRDESGFTLVEVMVVVLIIGILVAIALPTFLGARTRAEDRGADSNLRNGVAAAKTFFVDASTYVGFDVAAASSVEPSLRWLVGTSPAKGQVDIEVATHTQLELITLSASGTYYCISDDTSHGIAYGQNTSYPGIQGYANCTGGW